MKALWALTILTSGFFTTGLATPAAAQSGMVSSSTAASTRVTLPNDFGVELLGRCLIYDFSYQRMVTPLLGLEVAVSGLGSGSSSGGDSATLLFGSVGGRFYFINKNASPFLTGGFVGLSASTDTGPFGDDSATASYGYTGLGLEFRAPGGFLFRGTAYGLVAGGGYFIWPGLTIGYAF